MWPTDDEVPAIARVGSQAEGGRGGEELAAYLDTASPAGAGTTAGPALHQCGGQAEEGRLRRLGETVLLQDFYGKNLNFVGFSTGEIKRRETSRNLFLLPSLGPSLYVVLTRIRSRCWPFSRKSSETPSAPSYRCKKVACIFLKSPPKYTPPKAELASKPGVVLKTSTGWFWRALNCDALTSLQAIFFDLIR